MVADGPGGFDIEVVRVDILLAEGEELALAAGGDHGGEAHKVVDLIAVPDLVDGDGVHQLESLGGDEYASGLGITNEAGNTFPWIIGDQLEAKGFGCDSAKGRADVDDSLLGEAVGKDEKPFF